MPLGHGDDGFRRIGSRRERRRHVHDQNGVVGVIVEQILKRGGVSFGVGVAGDVDRIGARPDRRQCRIKLPHRVGRNAGELAAKIDEPIHRQHADPAAVGQNGQRLPAMSIKRASVSAAANSSSRSMTRNKPARRNAAS